MFQIRVILSVLLYSLLLPRTVCGIGMIIPPLTQHSKFTSSQTLLDLFHQSVSEESGRQLVIQEYMQFVPCLRMPVIDTDDDQELFFVIKFKFNNIGDNSFNSKGLKNQLLNMNVIHTNNKHVSIIRNKKDITVEELRIGFKVSLRGGGGNDELSICFENVLLDRSKLMKSLKSNEIDDLVTRHIELEISQFANFQEFHMLYNNYERDLVQDIEDSQLKLNQLDEVISAMYAGIGELENDENIKRDINERVFRLILLCQLGLMGAILIFNGLHLLNLLSHLKWTKIIAK